MQELSNPLVLNIDRLGQMEDSTGDTLWLGKDFSGIAFEEDPIAGAVIAVLGYRFGKPHGAAREWDAASRPGEEEYRYAGGNHGPFRRWYKSGQLAEFFYTERSINTRLKRWDESGKLLEEKVLLETEPRWANSKGNESEARARSSTSTSPR